MLLLTGCNENKPETQISPPMSRVIPGKTITIDQLETMFSNISEQTDWNLEEKMLWGYHFSHREPKALESIRDHLTASGYRFIDLYQPQADPGDTEPPIWLLHVEKEEIHTPQSLDQRNDNLYLLTAEYGIDLYRGMGVVPIKKQGEQDVAPQSATR